MESGVELPTNRILSFLNDTCMGMAYLHLFKIIHRDLKPGNLLVSEDWRVAITDFGVSRVTSKRMSRAIGTTFYIAPEMFTSDDYTHKVDIYSFSYIMWGLWMKEPPFQDLTTFQLVPEIVEKGLRPTVPEDCIYGSLMEKCWQEDASLRPSFSKLSYEFKKLMGEEGGDPGISSTSSSSSTSYAASHSSSTPSLPSPSAYTLDSTITPRGSPLCSSCPLSPSLSVLPDMGLGGEADLSLLPEERDSEEKGREEEGEEGMMREKRLVGDEDIFFADFNPKNGTIL